MTSSLHCTVQPGRLKETDTDLAFLCGETEHAERQMRSVRLLIAVNGTVTGSNVVGGVQGVRGNGKRSAIVNEGLADG